MPVKSPAELGDLYSLLPDESEERKERISPVSENTSARQFLSLSLPLTHSHSLSSFFLLIHSLLYHQILQNELFGTAYDAEVDWSPITHVNDTAGSSPSAQAKISRSGRVRVLSSFFVCVCFVFFSLSCCCLFFLVSLFFSFSLFFYFLIFINSFSLSSLLLLFSLSSPSYFSVPPLTRSPFNSFSAFPR